MGSDERRAPLKTLAWEVIRLSVVEPVFTFTRYVTSETDFKVKFMFISNDILCRNLATVIAIWHIPFPAIGINTFCYMIDIINAYHFYGKAGNSAENLNGKVHPDGTFKEKR